MSLIAVAITVESGDSVTFALETARAQAKCGATIVECEDPIAVGVDAGGIDIRRMHDVGRLPFPILFENAAQVRSFIEGASFPSNL